MTPTIYIVSSYYLLNILLVIKSVHLFLQKCALHPSIHCINPCGCYGIAAKRWLVLWLVQCYWVVRIYEGLPFPIEQHR